MDWQAPAEIAVAVVGGGGAVRLLDRWRYRGMARLDVAALSERIAATTLEHARAEIDRAWRAAEHAEQQVDLLRAELAEMRQAAAQRDAEVAELRRAVAQRAADRDQAAELLRQREAELAEARGQVAALTDEVARLTGLTQHAQASIGRTDPAG